MKNITLFYPTVQIVPHCVRMYKYEVTVVSVFSKNACVCMN